MNPKEEKELLEMFGARLQGYRENTCVSFKAGLLRDLLQLAKQGHEMEQLAIQLKRSVR